METGVLREDLDPVGDESCFLLPPLGKRVGKADPKVAGGGGMAAERQQAPGTDMGQPKKEGQKEDIYGTGEYV